MRRYYNYDPETQVYAGEELADVNQLEPGNYLLPAYATFILPPETIEKGKQAVFDVEENEWVIKDEPPPVIDLEANLKELHEEEVFGFQSMGDIFDA